MSKTDTRRHADIRKSGKNQTKTTTRKRWGESGNVFFTLFGAVAVVGVLGAGIMSTMRGPLSTMVDVNRIEQAKSEGRVQLGILLTQASNQDADGLFEPADPDNTCASATGTRGCIPGTATSDPWGEPYAYCAWNNGTVSNALGNLILQGGNLTTNIAVALISAGPDGTFQNTCEDATHATDPFVATQSDATGDDIIISMTYTEAVSGSGGLWTADDTDVNDPLATIDRNLDLTGPVAGPLPSPQLRLGAASMLLPLRSSDFGGSDTCAGGDINLLRINDAASPLVEICDGTNWVSASSIWTVSGSDLYYTAGNVGIGLNNPNDALDVVGTAEITGATVLGSTLDIQGTISNSTGDVTIGDALDLNGTLDVLNGTTLQSTLDVQGDVSDSTGDLTLADSVVITGTTDAQGDISDSTGDLTINDNAVITGTTDAQGDIADSTGDLTLADDVIITGTTDAQGDISDSTGDLTINDNLVVTGTSDLQGTVSDSTGNLTLGDTVDVTEDLNVTQNVDVDGTLEADDITWNGDDFTPYACTGTEYVYWDGNSWECRADIGAAVGPVPTRLNDLSDVVAGSPSNDECLVYNGTNWVNQSCTVAAGTLWEDAGTVIRISNTGSYATDDFVFGSGQLSDSTNANHDARFWFDKSRAAFRAGSVDGAQWDDASVGDYSVAFGLNNTASGISSFAAGGSSIASGTYSIALGNNLNSTGQNSMAWGNYTNATGQYSTAGGATTVASGTGSFAIGEDAIASGNQSFAFGLGDATGTGVNRPTVSGASSFGIFMGDQTGVDVTANNTMSIMGGTVAIGSVAASTGGEQDLEFDVLGDVGAAYYCDSAGNNCFQAFEVGGTGSGLWEVVAGLTRVRATATTGGDYATDDFVFGSNQLADTTDANQDARFFFDKSKAAFRAGMATGSQWDDANVGDSGSIGLGWNVVVSGQTAIGIGDRATASAADSVSIGRIVTSSADRGIAIGNESTASATDAYVIGNEATTSGSFSMALGLGDPAGVHPDVSANNSFGIFMGDQSAVDLTATNTMLLAGGSLIIDPTVPATNLVADTALDVSGSIKIGDGTELCNVAAHEGAIRYNAGAVAYQVCANSAVGWETLVTSAGGGLWTDNTTHITRENVHILDAGQTVDTAGLDGGIGAALIWDTDNGSLRAGAATGTQWDDANVGDFSIALGRNAQANGSRSVALGEGATASNYASTAIGHNTSSSGSYSIALGRHVQVTGSDSAGLGLGGAAGTYPEVSGNNSFGIFMGDQSGVDITATNTMSIMGGTVAIGDIAATTGGVQDLELDVTGDIGATNYCDADGNNCFTAASVVDNSFISDGDNNTLVQTDEGGADDNTIRFDTAGAERMTIGPTGVVDIATRLEIDSSSGTEIGFTGAGDTANITADGGMTVRAGTGQPLEFGANATHGLMTLQSDGDLELDGATGNESGCFRFNDTTDELEFSDDCTTFTSFSSGALGLWTNNTTHITREDMHVINAASDSTAAGLDGVGTYSFYASNKSAIRGGEMNAVDNTAAWQDTNIGDNSLAWGRNVGASGTNSAAFGQYTNASGSNSLAFGNYVGSQGFGSFTGGHLATSFGAYGFTYGDRIWNFGDRTAAFGLGVLSINDYPDVGSNGDESFVVFLGDQNSVEMDTPHTFGIFGGSVVIDPAQPATQMAPRASLDVGAATDALITPGGTTAQRPGTGVNGMIRYNSDNNKFEGYQNGAWTDIITTAGLWTDNTDYITRENFHVLDAGLAAGSTTAGLDGDGTYAFYDPDKGAFRGGVISGADDAWQDTNIGNNSFAWGDRVQASGNRSTALGSRNTAGGSNSFVVGEASSATGYDSISMGLSAHASSDYAVAIGNQVSAGTNNNAMALGKDVRALGESSLAIGLGSTAGTRPQVTGTNSLGIFMGDQDSEDLNVDNMVVIEGGSLMVGDHSLDNSTFVDAEITSARSATGAHFRWGPAHVNSSTMAGYLGHNGTNNDIIFNTNEANILLQAELGAGTATELFLERGTGNIGIGDFSGGADTLDSTFHVQAGDIRLDGGAANEAGCLRFDDTGDVMQFSNDCTTFYDIPLPGTGGLWTDNTTHVTRENVHILDAGETMTTAGLGGDSGYSMIWHSDKRAFRAGRSWAGQWSEGNVGSMSFAYGYSPIASGSYSFAFGREISATGDYSFAIGGADASGVQPVVSGNNSFGIFMGDQSGTNISADNTFSIMGGTMAIGDVAATTGGVQDLELDVTGDIGGQNYCDDAGNNCFTAAAVATLVGGAVTEIDDLTDALADYATDNNLIMGRPTAAALTTGAQRNIFVGQGSGATTANSTATTDDNTALGYDALAALTSGAHNVAVGSQAGSALTSGDYNTFIGDDAGLNTTTADYNTALGGYALRANTTGDNNTAIGDGSLEANTTGNRNTATGRRAMFSSTIGNDNTAFGEEALYTNVAKSASTAIGYEAMRYADDSAVAANTNNTALGYQALRGSTTASNNTGTGNVAVGHQSLRSITSGSFNNALGSLALFNNTTGVHNNAFGWHALTGNTVGDNNVAMGRDALAGNVAKSNNTAIGHQAMQYADDTTTASDSYNTALGYNALRGSSTASSNTGDDNTAVGGAALSSNTSGSNNTAVGRSALTSNTSGLNNTAIGWLTMQDTDTGRDNTAIGYRALTQNTDGDDNVAIGYNALLNTTGDSNVAIGYQAGALITTGQRNILIGNGADVPTATTDNYINIGNLITGTRGAGLVTIEGTGALTTPIGTTAERPGTAVNGMIRYNSTTGKFEGYQSGSWQDIITTAASGTGLADADNDTLVQVEESSDEDMIRFDTAGTERMIIDNLGQVGIGATPANRSLTLRQLTNGEDALTIIRNTDTAWVGDFIKIRNAADSADIFALGNTLASQNPRMMMGNLTLTSSGGCCSHNSLNTTSNSLSIGIQGAGEASELASIYGTQFRYTPTTGSLIDLQLGQLGSSVLRTHFDPSSGTAEYTVLRTTGTVEQSGTATGTTRGVHIDPNLIGAYDYRALEIAGYTKPLVGTTPTTLQQVLFNEPTFTAAAATTVTNAATQVITGAPNAGTNVTITNPYAIWVQDDISRFDGDIVMGGTGAITVANGTTAQRPGTAVNGMLRYNSTTGRFEGYQAGSWQDIITSGGLWTDNTTHITRENVHILDAGETMTTAGFDGGSGDGLVFHTDKGAIRAGSVAASRWNEANIGIDSVGMGSNPAATGTGSVALGWGPSASSDSAVAIGRDTESTGVQAVSIGSFSDATASYTAIFGHNLVASTPRATAFGQSAISSGSYSMAFGAGYDIDSSGGTDPTVSGDYSVGFFMGDNDGIDVADANTFSIMGATGGVGIGTVSPGASLDIVGEDSATPALTVTGGENPSGAGSDITLTAGLSTLQAGGSVILTGGRRNHGFSGFGSSITVGGAANFGPGGTLALAGGNSANGYGGADVTITGGNGSVNGTGGDIVINGGTPSGTGANGNIILGNLRGLVGIGTATPAASLDIATTDALITPRGTTAQRPGTGIDGMLRYNSTTNRFEGYQNGSWQDIITAGGTAGGSDTQVQYNNGGAFAGDSGFTYSAGTDTLTISSTINAGELVNIGSTTGAATPVGAVNGSNSLDLNNLNDVDVTGVTDGQILAYNNTSGNWEASNAGGSSQVFEVTGAAGSEVVSSVDANAPYTTSDFVFGSSQLDDTTDSNHDSRFFFDKSKGAFRAGTMRSGRWDDASRGDHSFASGWDTLASGARSTAMGRNVDAIGDDSFAWGWDNEAHADHSVTFGRNIAVDATGTYSMAFGLGAMTGRARISGANSFGIFMGDQGGEDITAANTMAILGANTILMGTSDAGDTVTHSDPYLKIFDNDDIWVRSYANGSTKADIDIQKARGSESTPLALADGDSMGTLRWTGYDGDSWEEMAKIGVDINGTVSDGNIPSDMVFETDANERIRIQHTGDVVLTNDLIVRNGGTQTDFEPTVSDADIMVDGDVFAVVAGNSTGDKPDYDLGRARGTFSSKLKVEPGDDLGTLRFSAWDSNNFNDVARIGVRVPSGAADTADNDVPTEMFFMTSPDGSGTEVERMRIESDGSVVMLGTTALTVHTGTTAQRPGTGVDGMLRYNSTTGKFEGYQAGSWQDLITAAAGAGGSDTQVQFNTGGALDGDAGFTYNAGSDTLTIGSTLNVDDLVNIGSTTGAAAPTGAIDTSGTLALNNLSDVDVAGVTDGQIIAYNAGSGNWEASNAGGSSQIFEVTGLAGSEVVSSVDANAPYATSDFVFGSSQLADTGDTNHDSRMFFDKSKGAFRVGTATGTQWDDVNVGVESFAAGHASQAGAQSVAMGDRAVATGQDSVALGRLINITTDRGYAMGNVLNISGGDSVALGRDADVSGSNSMAVGLGIPAGASPVVSGNNSLGIFMGDQSGVDVTQANAMAIMGGDVGINTVTPQVALDVNGTLRVANGGETCDGTIVGAIRYNAGALEFCNGTSWQAIGVVSGAINLQITPNNSTGMDVTGPGAPATGTTVSFTLTNLGTATTDPLSYNLTGNTANFNVTGDTCTGNTLAGGGTCQIDVQPQTSGDGPYAASLTIPHHNTPIATLSGTGSGFGCGPGVTGWGGIVVQCDYAGVGNHLIVNEEGCNGATINPTCSGGDTYERQWSLNQTDDYSIVESLSDGDQNSVNALAYARPGGSLPAIEYCDALNDNGETDWFLPAPQELQTAQANIASDFGSHLYWTSAECASGTHDFRDAGVVNMTDGIYYNCGNSSSHDKPDNNHVRCMRIEGVALPSGQTDNTTQDLVFDPAFVTSAGLTTTSSTVTVTSITPGTSISISGATAEYRINGGSWTNAAGTVDWDDTVQLRIDSAAPGNSAIASIIIGTETHHFSVITEGDCGGAGCSGVDKRVFLTSTNNYGTSLGGLSGADAQCQSHADTAGLGGTWQAILSGSAPANWAVNRLDYNWDRLVNMNGAVIATSGSDLWDGTIGTAINYDENGTLVTDGDDVWTGSYSNGSAYNTASDFTSGNATQADYAGTSGGTWMNVDPSAASANNHLYCQEVTVGSITLTSTPSSGTSMNVVAPGPNGSEVIFTIQNTGTGTSGALSYTLSNSTNFTLTTNNCSGNTLAASATCTMGVTPTASADGDYNGTLTVTDATNSVSVNIGISGQATGFGATSSIWSTGAGSDIYYNTGTPQVGIGTSTPDDTLDVVGTVEISSGAPAAAVPLTVSKVYNTSQADIMVLENNDTGGYGDNNDTADILFQLEGGSSSQVGSNGGRLGFGWENAVNRESFFRIQTGDNNVLTERFRIDHDGNVGIGTSTPDEALEVFEGNIKVGDASNSIYGMVFERNGSEAGRIDTTNSTLSIIPDNGNTINRGSLTLLQGQYGIIFNDNGGDSDFWLSRVDSDGDSGTDNDTFQIGGGTTIGTSNFLTMDNVGNITLDGTGALTVNSGTAAQRPGTPVNGMLRYNADTDKFEGYQNGSWQDLITTAAGAGGADTQVQFNTGGALDGDAGFTYSAGTDTLTISSTINAGELVNIGSTTGAAAPVGTADTPTTLSNITDVDVTGASNGDCLVYNNTSGNWEDGSCGSGSLSWPLLAPDGTAAAPSYSFTNFPTAGMYVDGNQDLNIHSHGNEMIFVADTGSTFSTDHFVWEQDGNESMILTESTLNVGPTSQRSQDIPGIDIRAGQLGEMGMVITNTYSGEGDSVIRFELAEDTPTFTVGIDDSDGDSFKISNGAMGTNDRFVVTPAGNVGIGISAPAEALDVSGNIQFTGILIDASDERLKKDITPLQDDTNTILSRLDEISGYSFRMKDDESGQVEYGVMAQEVERVFPELVQTADDEMGTKSVNYLGLIAPLIEASKELKAENAELKAKMDAKDERMAAIEARMAAFEGDVNDLKEHTGFGMSKASAGILLLLLALIGGQIIVLIRRKQA